MRQRSKQHWSKVVCRPWAIVVYNVEPTLDQRRNAIWVMEATVLAYPNSENLFILDTDASNHAIGAELLQVQNGVERLIGFVSFVIDSAQRNFNFFHIRNIGKIRNLLSYTACSTIIHALISCRFALSLREAAHSGSGALSMGREAAVSGSPIYPGQF